MHRINPDISFHIYKYNNETILLELCDDRGLITEYECWLFKTTKEAMNKIRMICEVET